MWTRKDLKKKGKVVMRHNYWRIVGVLLIVTFVISGLRLDVNVGSSITEIGKASISRSEIKRLSEGKIDNKTSVQIVDSFMTSINPKDSLYNVAEKKYKPTAGVFAAFYNNTVAAKSFMVGSLNAVNTMFFKDRLWPGTIIFVSAFLMLMIWIFIGTPLLVGQCRYLLEARSYKDTKIGAITFIWRVGKVKKIALTMFLKQTYWFLWCITIVGGIVKYYSYRMIPYILAENPEMERRDVFALSETMMRGQKWETFKLDMSFLGWYVLNIFTFGILEWTYIKPYKETTRAELYLVLRREAKEAKTENSEFLFDEYLGTPCSEGMYPMEYSPFYRSYNFKFLSIDYKRNYKPTSIILIFFTCSFIGWVWEVLLHLYEDGVFVNRGTMHGPWLPIYGVGGVIAILFLKRFASSPGKTFALSIVTSGIIEYGTATALWHFKHAIWWDYTGYFLNIQGRVCAEGLVLFAIGSMGFIYLIGPVLDELFKRVPRKVVETLCILLIAAFILDGMYSIKHPNTGPGITEYAPQGKLVERQLVNK